MEDYKSDLWLRFINISCYVSMAMIFFSYSFGASAVMLPSSIHKDHLILPSYLR